MPKQLSNTLRRYTSLTVALDMLINRHIVLISPSKWDDGNDAHFIDLYKSSKEVGSVLASCMTMSTETYHHWKIFSGGLDGVCIEFNRPKLEADVGRRPEVRFEPVEYLLLKDLQSMSNNDVGRLPFIKRDAYGDEREWRMISTPQEENIQTWEVPISLASIERVRLSPWTNLALRQTIRTLIRAQDGCERMSVVSSGLTNSAKWRQAGAAIAS